VNEPALEAYLHEHIPISRAMGIAVVEATDARISLRAPLEPNVNHRSTVFGGSCASVAILAAWTLVHLRVQAMGIAGRVVIQRGATEYRLPIHGIFTATCESPGKAAWERFDRALQRRGQARVELDAVVTSDGVVVATFSGAYVAIAGLPEGDDAGGPAIG
jgi:thioesterase domain-containing protein